MSEKSESDGNLVPRHLCRGFGPVFKKIRERRRLSQVAVAKALHVTQAAVSRWEAEKDAPGEKVVFDLAYLYGVSPEQLGWTRFDAVDFERLNPAGPVRGTFLTDEEREKLTAAHQERERVKREVREAAAEARRIKKAAQRAAEMERVAEERRRKQELANKLRFNTPYYRAQREQEARRLEVMTPVEVKEAEFWENFSRGLKLCGRS